MSKPTDLPRHAPPRATQNPAVSVRLHTVAEHEAGQRIDNFLLRVCKGVPKSWVYRVVRKGEVRVNKGRIDVDYKLQTGDVVRIPPVRVSESTPAVVPAHRANKLPIIFEDDALLIVDKPAGLAVHGGSGVSFGVIEQLRAAYPQLKFLELVHRLDKETSGLLVLAKKRSALVHLHEQIRNGRMDKRYYAILKGQLTDKVTHVKAPLHKYVAANGERRVVVAHEGEGQSAHTQFNVEQIAGDFTVVRVKIFTGRTHQIRVHMQHIGHPLVGDPLYGEKRGARSSILKGVAGELDFKRQALHAYSISFLDIDTGEKKTITTQLPLDIKNAIEKIKSNPEEYSSAFAITEKNNMYSIIDFYKHGQKASNDNFKFNSIVGIDLTF